MGTCVFNAADVKRCVIHALNAAQHEMPFAEDETPTPALLFVHDSGVYLMSNGVPRDIISINNSDTGGEERNYIVYAAGTNPTENNDWWHASANLVGGDDFVEILPVTRQWLEDCDTFQEFYVTITGNQMEAGFRKRNHAEATV